MHEPVTRTQRRAVVYGASGHTGHLVAHELHARGWAVTLAGRHLPNLTRFGGALGASARVASVDAPGELDDVIAGSDVVINCAGPFRTTAPPIIAAATRAGAAYIDVAAEIETVLDTLGQWDIAAREAGTLVVPAVGFYGGLGGLVAAEALGSWTDAERIELSYGLNEWIPTAGTLVAGAVSRERRRGAHPIFTDGALSYTEAAPSTADWSFPPPLGHQLAASPITMVDAITIAHQTRVLEIVSYMPAKALADLTSGAIRPAGSSEGAPSAQQFALRAVAFRAGEERAHTVWGGDIYGVTAPLVAEVASLVVASKMIGTRVASEFGAPGELLRSLAPYLHDQQSP